jgi:hypothetical protein
LLETKEHEWGQRITDGKILQLINDNILPKCKESDELSAILIIYVQFISEIIDNEPNLIRILLKQGDDHTGLINNLLSTLKEFKLNQRGTHA